MNIVEIETEIRNMVKDCDQFLQITSEEIMNKFHQFCVENNIEVGSDEYLAIANLGMYHTKFIFGYYLSSENLKHIRNEEK